MASSNNFFGTDDEATDDTNANLESGRQSENGVSRARPGASPGRAVPYDSPAGASNDAGSSSNIGGGDETRFAPPSVSEVAGSTSVTEGAIWLLLGLGAGLLCLSGWYLIFGSSKPVGARARARSWLTGWNADGSDNASDHGDDQMVDVPVNNLNNDNDTSSPQQLQQPVIYPVLPPLPRSAVPAGGVQVPRHQFNEFRRRTIPPHASQRISSVARTAEPTPATSFTAQPPEATTPLIFWSLDPTGTQLVKFHNPTVQTPGTIVGDLTRPARSMAILATPAGADAIMLDAGGSVETVDVSSGAVKRVLSAQTEGLLDLAANSFGDVFAINSSGGLLVFDKAHARFAPFAPAQHLSALMVSMDFDADDNLHALSAAGQLHMLPAEELTAQSTTRAAWRRLGSMVLGSGGRRVDVQTVRIDRGDGALYAASSDGHLFSSSLDDPLVVTDVGQLPSSIFAIQSATAGFARA
jgi:hypothetical protein